MINHTLNTFINNSCVIPTKYIETFHIIYFFQYLSILVHSLILKRLLQVYVHFFFKQIIFLSIYLYLYFIDLIQIWNIIPIEWFCDYNFNEIQPITSLLYWCDFLRSLISNVKLIHPTLKHRSLWYSTL